MVSVCILISMCCNVFLTIKYRRLTKKHAELEEEYATLTVRYAEQAFLLGQYTIGEKSK